MSETDLEGTGLNLAVNRHGNLTSASNDQDLTNVLHQIKSSKSPVSRFLLSSLFFLFLDDVTLKKGKDDKNKFVSCSPLLSVGLSSSQLPNAQISKILSVSVFSF